MLTGRTFTRTTNLVLRFKEYGALVSEPWPTRLDLRMPFFYLRTQGFWQGFTTEMAPAHSPESCFACELNEEFFLEMPEVQEAVFGDCDRAKGDEAS